MSNQSVAQFYRKLDLKPKGLVLNLLFWLLIIMTINISIISFVILYGLLGLIFSDFIIALMRKKDENNMIYVD